MTVKQLVSQIAALCIVAAGAAAIVWHIDSQELRRRDAEDTLKPIATLLEENKKVIESMKKDGLVESESVIVSTYLERIRKDGVPKNSDMKHRVDSLVNNNTMIVVLLSKYLPRARTAEFRVAALKFTDYAAGFRDRWQSIFEIFMVGGRVPSTNEDRSELLTHALERELSTD